MANDGTVRIGTLLDDSGFKSGLSKLGGVAKASLSGVTAAVGVASTAVGVLVKQSLDAYSSYEQLTGGVETLFKDSANAVMEYADNAYKTAGMSANEYMETVTSFSASLLQGLGGDTAAAAEVANQAITDMSDNANKMGTSMEMIQNAYQGFAKQNYTMLDNLKLGYGGTQAEMARLINDSGVLGDTMTVTAKNINEVSFDKIIEAIHVIQTNMGITGTTAKEASTTIEGSVNSMKAAFTNLITGIADDNADLDTLISNFVTSFEIAASNILPRIEKILLGFGSTIEKLSPIIAESLPSLVEQILPSLLNAGSQLLTGLLNGIIQALPNMVDATSQIVLQLAYQIIEMLPQLADSALQIILQFANFLTQSLPELIPAVVEIILEIVDALLDNLDLLIDAAVELILALTEGLIEALPMLTDKAPEIISKLASALVDEGPRILYAAMELMVMLNEGIAKGFLQILANIGGWVYDALIQPLLDEVSAFADIGRQLIEGLWNGIGDKVEWLKGKVTGVVDTIKSWFTGSEGFDTHSPSKWSEEIGGNIDDGLAQGMTKGKNTVRSAALDIVGAASILRDAIPSATLGVSYANAAMTPSSVSTPRFTAENAVASAAGMLALSQSSGSREIVLTLNGIEMARAIIDNIRSVESQSPAIVSD